MNTVRGITNSFNTTVALVAITSLILTLLLALIPHKANAAWVSARPFDYSALSAECNRLTHYGGLNKGPRNYGNNVGGWYCYVTSSNQIWIKPGNACTAKYGGSYKFVLTYYYTAYGGYCAIWR